MKSGDKVSTCLRFAARQRYFLHLASSHIGQGFLIFQQHFAYQTGQGNRGADWVVLAKLN